MWRDSETTTDCLLDFSLFYEILTVLIVSAVVVFCWIFVYLSLALVLSASVLISARVVFGLVLVASVFPIAKNTNE